MDTRAGMSSGRGDDSGDDVRPGMLSKDNGGGLLPGGGVHLGRGVFTEVGNDSRRGMLPGGGCTFTEVKDFRFIEVGDDLNRTLEEAHCPWLRMTLDTAC